MTFNTQSYSWSQFWHSSRFCNVETVIYLFLKTTGSASLSLYTSTCFSEALNFICPTRYFVFGYHWFLFPFLKHSLIQTQSHQSHSLEHSPTNSSTHSLTHCQAPITLLPAYLYCVSTLISRLTSDCLDFFQSRPAKEWKSIVPF